MLPAISALFGKAGVSGDAMDYFLVPIAIKGVPQMLAKKVGIAPEDVADTLIAEMGHSGAAHPLVMLSDVLEKESGRASRRERACPYVSIVVVAGSLKKKHDSTLQHQTLTSNSNTNNN